MSKGVCDFLIVGAGIMGLSLAAELRRRFRKQRIILIDKEQNVAAHASGRNSGVLHAGFYYSADSLKARFSVRGTQAIKEFCRDRNLPLNECGKLVVAQNEDELATLDDLIARGKKNGVNVSLLSEKEALEIEPNLRTFHQALYSPNTATVDPLVVCREIKKDLQSNGIEFLFGTRYLQRRDQRIITSAGNYSAGMLINCAGLYADKIARDFGIGEEYCILPLKGLYLKYVKNDTDIRTNIYPVPNLKHPMLGVHFTKSVDGSIKIGPTAIPAFWRENYSLARGFSLQELLGVVSLQSSLFIRNSFNFRAIVFEEVKKYSKKYMIGQAANLVKQIDRKGFGGFTAPGIRAQLVRRSNLELVEDFVVAGDSKSIHVLNAVSPALTCAFPFAEYVVDSFVP